MTKNMCEHGYTYGMCPKGCHKPVESASEPLPKGPPLWEEPAVEAKLCCIICGEVVESGKVYKGKPICDPCMDGMKSDPIKPKVPRVTEEIVKKFPTQGQERLSAKDIKTAPE